MNDGFHNKFRRKIYNSIFKANGLVSSARLGLLQANENVNPQVSAKCQFFNPLSSAKDRVWLAMIEAIKPNNGIQGIGPGFVPKNFKPVPYQQHSSYRPSESPVTGHVWRVLAVAISSGAALAAAVVAILPSSAER